MTDKAASIQYKCPIEDVSSLVQLAPIKHRDIIALHTGLHVFTLVVVVFYLPGV